MAELSLHQLVFCAKCNCDTSRCSRGKCSPCERARYARYRNANPDKVKAAQAKYRSENKEKQKIRSAIYNAANKEKLKEKEAARYARDPAAGKARFAEWAKKNPEKRRESLRLWTLDNPDYRRIYEQNRRAMKRKNGGELSKGLAQRLMTLQKGRCAICRELLGVDFAMDHIMPVKLGGPNTDENIQLLHKSCNSSKNASHPVDYMQSKGFLI